MSITRVQYATDQTNGGTTLFSSSTDFGSNQAVGNLIVAVVNSGIFGGGSGGDPTSFSGWNKITQYAPSFRPNSYITYFWRFADAADQNAPTITWDSNSQRTGYIVELASDVGWPADPFDTASSGADSSSAGTSQATGTSGTLSGDLCVALAVLTQSGGTAIGSTAALTGYTRLGNGQITNAGGGDSANEIVLFEKLDIAGGGTEGGTITWTGSRDSAALVVVFQESSSGTTEDYLYPDGDVTTTGWASNVTARNGYVTFDGAGDYLESSDPTPETGDLDIIMLVAPDDVTPAGTQNLLTHCQLSAGGGGWRAAWTTTSQIQFNWWDGSLHSLSATIPGVSDGVPAWLKLEVDVSTGLVDLYYSTDPVYTNPDLVSWTFITTEDNGGAITISTTSQPVRFGQQSGSEHYDGKVYLFWYRETIGSGSWKVNVDLRDAVQGWDSPPGVDDQANTFTFNGDAAWTAPTGSGDLYAAIDEEPAIDTDYIYTT